MSIKALVNDKKTYDDFCEFVKENFLDVAYKQIKQEDDTKRIYRKQGEIAAYEKMLNLREIVNGKP